MCPDKKFENPSILELGMLLLSAATQKVVDTALIASSSGKLDRIRLNESNLHGTRSLRRDD